MWWAWWKLLGPPKTTATKIVKAVLNDLAGRGGIKHEMALVECEVVPDLLRELTEVVQGQLDPLEAKVSAQPPDLPQRGDVGLPECTRDPIFLLKSFQRRPDFWKTESVWFTRQEAEDFALRTEYRYDKGWRVYCTTAEGQLAKLLRARTNAPKGRRR